MTDERTLMDELREVDALLPGLAAEEPPPELVEAVLERVAATPLPADELAGDPPPRRWPRPPRWLAVAASLVVLVAGSTWVMMQFGHMDRRTPPASKGLFNLYDTADAEIDHVDSTLGGDEPAVAADEWRAPDPSEDPLAGLGLDTGTLVQDLDGLGGLGYVSLEPAVHPPPSEPQARYRIPTSPAPSGTPEPTPSPGSESYAHAPEEPFRKVADRPLSTFSIDVDTASYANVRRYLNRGALPPVNAVRVEELINYFDYQYDAPSLDADVPFSVTTEVGPAPWAPDHKLVHVGLQAADLPADAVPPRNLVFLVDVSGSMNSSDKLPLLVRGLSMLVPQLDADDRVAIVTYAGSAGVALPPTSGAEDSTILGALDRLTAGGSTHGSQGIVTAYELARRSFLDEGVNRVLLATDGDFNVGTTSDDALVELIERERESGVFLTVLGFGTGNLKDSKMEALADHGNGNYAYIDSAAEAHKVLVREAGSTLVTVAKDVKIQVEFNPATVAAYRLIGYDNRRLADRDFTDDTKDAGEVGAGHSVTALYEIVPAGGAVPGDIELRYQRDKEPTAVSTGSDEWMFVKVRYKKPDGRRSTEHAWPVTGETAALRATSDDYRFSAAIAGWGLLLKGSPYVGDWTMADASDLAGSALRHDPAGDRQQAMELMDVASRLAGSGRPAAGAGGYRPR